jgi:hypothetical protein
MHGTVIKSGYDGLENLVREWTCTRSRRRRRLKLFFSLMDAAVVRAFDCECWWILTGSNRRIIRRLYQPSLGEEMVRTLIRGRDGSGNVNRHICRAVRARDVPCKQTAFSYNCKEKRRKTVWKVFCVSSR